MRVFDRIKNFHRVLFVFDHGLGDLLQYIPVHNEFTRQVGKRIELASPAKRQYHKIDPLIKSYESLDVKGYEYVYRLFYPDSKAYKPPFEYHDEPAKPYLCAFYELGMEHFVWKPHKLDNPFADVDSKRVGVHFFGHTGANEKFCPKSSAEAIWDEIVKAGYEPFECHMRPNFRSDYRDCGDDDCRFITEENSLRFYPPDLKLMKDEIGKCKYFISVDSGPLYLASALIGFDRLIGLENLKRISYYCPKPFQKVSVREYRKGTISELIKRKEDANV
jgi:hypothetical protein